MFILWTENTIESFLTKYGESLRWCCIGRQSTIGLESLPECSKRLGRTRLSKQGRLQRDSSELRSPMLGDQIDKIVNRWSQKIDDRLHRRRRHRGRIELRPKRP